MKLIPTKKQWKGWNLPSKLTAIGAYLAIITLGLYFFDKCSENKINSANLNLTKNSIRENQDSLLKPFEGGAINVRIDTSKKEVPVNIELVQIPKESDNLWFLYFDVYLRNVSDKDILFTSINYTLSCNIPHGDGEDSGTVFPNAMYEFEYEIEIGENSFKKSLTPPYELKSKDLRAIRFHFRPKDMTPEFLPCYFSFELIDSKGRKLSIQ